MQDVMTPTKIEARGSAGMLATERTSAIVGKPVTAGPASTAFSKQQKCQQHQGCKK